MKDSSINIYAIPYIHYYADDVDWAYTHNVFAPGINQAKSSMNRLMGRYYTQVRNLLKTSNKDNLEALTAIGKMNDSDLDTIFNNLTDIMNEATQTAVNQQNIQQFLDLTVQARSMANIFGSKKWTDNQLNDFMRVVVDALNIIGANGYTKEE